DSIYETLFGSISEEDLDRTALIDAGATEGTTYRELIGRINAFAGALAARGIEVGDKVALLSPNTSAFAFVFHGILRAGATATTVNALFTAPEIAKQLTDSGAKMLITITQLGDQ
ncbi:MULTISPECIES: AMP-binding protein, partial [Actinomycetes]